MVLQLKKPHFFGTVSVAAVSGCNFCCIGGSPTPKKALIVSRYIVSGCRKNPPCCKLYPVAAVSGCTCIRCCCISLYPRGVWYLYPCIRLQLYLVTVAIVSHYLVSGCSCISLHCIRLQLYLVVYPVAIVSGCSCFRLQLLPVAVVSDSVVSGYICNDSF